MTPERAKALRDFAARALSDETITVEAASADASFRSYWRVSSGDPTRAVSWIVMDAPPGKEDLGPWLDVAKRLRNAHLHAPVVMAEDRASGFVLMSDLGSRLFLWELTHDSVDALYGDALTALVTMQTRADATGLPLYDDALLHAELGLFQSWFVEKHLGGSLTRADNEVINPAFRVLIASALEQPQVFVHRDFHSRNLLITSPNPGIVDFQDAVLGPLTYDLVSLLRDCYIEWPAEQVWAWANKHRDKLVDKGLMKFGELRWKRWFDLMGMQRHLKVLGIFCRLHYRDGKAGFLKELPLVLKYTLEVSRRYKELAPFAQWLEARVGARDITQPLITV